MWAAKSFGDIGVNETIAMLQARAEAVAGSDLNGAKGMLITQASALDAIFNDLARRASNCMGSSNNSTNLTAADAYLRMAFKARGQCRATLQALGELVNPRSVAFIRQAKGRGPYFAKRTA